MMYSIETCRARHEGSGFCITSVATGDQISRISIVTKLHKPNWIYREAFEIPAGYDEVKLKMWGTASSSMHVELLFDHGDSVNHTFYMVNYGPKQLYRLAKLLVDEHKRIRPDMLQ
jgi:hypothetical protein